MTSAANLPKKPGGSARVFLVPGCGLLVALGVVVLLAGFFWLGLFRPASPVAPPIDDPMALLPADSNWVVGADLDKLREAGTLGPMLQFLTNPPAGVGLGALPEGLAEVASAGQSVLIAGSVGDDKVKPVVIVTTRGPADAEKIKSACHAGAVQQIHGYTAYRTQMSNGEAGKKPALGWLAFPGDRVAVWSEATEADFAARLAAASKAMAHPAADSIREARARPLWAVLHFDARMKQKLKETIPKDMGELAASLGKGQGAIVKLAFPEKARSADVTLDVLYANEADAAEMAKESQKSWKENKPLLQGAVIFMSLQNHPATGLVRDLTRTLAIDAKGKRTLATMQISEKTLAKFEGKRK